MLAQFSVKNFRSIKDAVTLCLHAVDRGGHEQSLLAPDSDVRLLPTIALFGANASGKSSILSAMHMVWSMVGSDYVRGRMLEYEPFLFSQEMQNQPTEMDIVFYQQGIRYAYGFAYNRSEIVSEYLYYWPKSRKSVLFERSHSIFRSPAGVRAQIKFTEQTPPSMLYLAMCGEWRVPSLREAYDWFSKQFFPLIKPDELHPGSGAYLKIVDSEQYAHLAEGIMREDFGVEEVRVSKRFNQESSGIYFKHRVASSGLGEDGTFWLPIESESSGVRNYFALLGLTGFVTSFGGVIPLDTLDAGLHPHTKQRLISLFANPGINQAGAQLIFGTYDVSLMDFSLLRRDQIWLAQMNASTLATELVPLSSLSAYTQEECRALYVSGKSYVPEQKA